MREITIALPTSETDLYRIHQHVWRHVVQACGTLREPPYFLYRVDGPLVRVRSDAFARAAMASSFTPGRRIYVDLAALHGGGKKQPVPSHLLENWCARQLALAGLSVRTLNVLTYEVRKGFKAAGGHTITIPVVRAEADVWVTDQRTCERSWRVGIGRGKRFGLGMLSH
jgi:hypothetical protein